jgi:hypothetical protein
MTWVSSWVKFFVMTRRHTTYEIIIQTPSSHGHNRQSAAKEKEMRPCSEKLLSSYALRVGTVKTRVPR